MRKICFIICLLINLSLNSEDGTMTISKIIAEIDSYRNKTVTMNMRLKYVDYIFEKIFFYDSDNADIEFDISGKSKRKELANDLINIHEGMVYRVRFTVIGTGALGGLTGDLIEFAPLIIDKIPDDLN
jgi:hypothetical protein